MPEWIVLDAVHPALGTSDAFQLLVEGERVRKCVVAPGAGFRGVEKVAESKTWDGILSLVERVCGVCASSHAAAAVLAMEELGRVTVPERAQFIRTLACEMERIHSHLLWFGVLGHCLGHVSLWMHSWKTRELVCEVSERVSGNRLNRDLFMPGGVRRDLDEEALPWIAERLDRIKPALDAIGSVFFDDAVVRARTRGVGILSEETVRHYGAVGPLARASGVAVDVRKDDPYFAYPWVDWDLAIEKEGDVQAKARVRFSELGASIRIVEQCLDRLRPGPVAAHVRSLPPGMGIGRVEAPRGELFHCLVCDGTESPIRYHIRAPSYANLRTNEAACRGEELDDAVLVVAASDPCMACTERLVSVDAADPSHSARTGEELVRMSQAKTARLRKVPHQAAMKGIKGTG